MNQGSRDERIQKLQHRIECLIDIQESLRAALKEPCAKDRRNALENSLRRHKASEEKARKELAAIQ